MSNIRYYFNQIVGKCFVDSDSRAYFVNGVMTDSPPNERLELRVTYLDNKKASLKLEDHLGDEEVDLSLWPKP